MQFALDGRAGQLEPLSHYLARYPGAEQEVTREYERLTAKDAPEATILGLPEPGESVAAYRLTSRIGVGGQGVVFAAEDERLGRGVAIKFLHLTGAMGGVRLERFRREAEIISRLDHPGLCTIFDADLSGRLPYIVMPLLSGSPLSRRIRESRESRDTCEPDWLRPTSRDQLEGMLAAFESVARALHVAHAAGIVHRDIKPGNLMCQDDGSLVVLDFGLARAVGQEDARMTRSGDRFGTPAYMSPEQLDAGAVDRRSDVYSLAASLYESLTLEPLHDAALGTDSRSSEVSQRLRRLRPQAFGAAAELATVLEHALSEEPDRRYATALVFAEELERLRLRHPVLARPTSLTYRTRKFVERNRRFVAATVTVMGILAVAATLAGWGLLQAKSTQANLERQIVAGIKKQVLDELRSGNGSAARALLDARPDIVDSWEGRILDAWTNDLGSALATGPATRLAATRDGKWLVTLHAGNDGRVFDLESGREAHRLGLEGFSDFVPGGAPFAESQYRENCFLLIATNDRSVVVLNGTYLWYVPDLARPEPRRIPMPPVRSATFDGEGRLLGLYDRVSGKLSVIELAGLTVVASRQVLAHDGELRFDSDGRLLKLNSSSLESWDWRAESGAHELKELPEATRLWGPDATWYLEEIGTGTRLMTVRGDVLAEGEGSLGAGSGRPFLRTTVAEPNDDFVTTVRGGTLAVAPTAGRALGVSKVPFHRSMSVCLDGSGRLFRALGDETIALDVTRLESNALPFRGVPAVRAGPATSCLQDKGFLVVFDGAALESARRVELLARSITSPLGGGKSLDELSRNGDVFVRVGQLIRRHDDWYSIEVHDLRRGAVWIRDLRSVPHAESLGGDHVAVGTTAGVEVHRIEDGTELTGLDSIPGPVVRLRLEEDGATLFTATAGDAPILMRTDVRTGSTAWSIELDQDPVALAASSSSGWVAVAVGDEGRIELFDADTGAAAGRLQALAKVTDMDLHPGDEDLLAVVARDWVQLFDLVQSSERLSVQSTLGLPGRIAFTQDGDSLQYAGSAFVVGFGRTYDRRVALERHRVAGAVELVRSLYATWPMLEDVRRELEAGIWPGDVAERALQLAALFESPVVLNKLAWDVATTSPLGDLDLALRYVRRAVELRPDLARHWNTLALVLMELGDAQGAAAALDRTDAINADDDPLTVPNGLGPSPYNLFLSTLIRLELGEHERALADYREATQLITSGAYAPWRHEFRPWIERCLASGGAAFR
ncbi:MAG: protein kinase [bacterium]|nr:protein kinase [bacterium]